MSRFAGKTNGRCHQRRALNMVEVAISMVIVSVILLTAMNMVGAAGVTKRSMTDRGTGHLLAEQLMAEVLEQLYEDPDYSPGSFGLEGFESVTKDRSYYDDVDDYHGWASSPPKNKDGSVITGYAGWKRLVTVRWVDSADLGTVVQSDTGLKRVLVTVTRNGILVSNLQALRANTGDME